MTQFKISIKINKKNKQNIKIKNIKTKLNEKNKKNRHYYRNRKNQIYKMK